MDTNSVSSILSHGKPSKLEKYNYIFLILVIFGGFFIFGFSENIKGPALPRMQSEFNLNEMQLGWLLAFNSLGYLIACSFTGVLSKKIGIKATGIIAFLSMTACGVLMYLSVNYAFLSISYFLLYVGNGILEIALAIMAARIFIKNTGTMMNLAHFFYGLSSTVAPICASTLMVWNILGNEFGWRGMYLSMLSLSLLPIIPAFLARIPGNSKQEKERISLKNYIQDPAAWIIIIILSFGVVSEMAVGGWLVNYLEKVYDWNMNEASGMLSIFFVFFMLSRLLLGPLTDKIGYTVSIMIFSAFSGISSLAAVMIGEKGAILFAVAGIGIAPIYPTVMAMLAKRYSKGTDTAITFTVMLLGIASVVGNLLIGVIIDWFNTIFTSSTGNAKSGLIIGLQAGYSFIAILALLCSVACMVLYIYLRKRNELV